MALKLLCTREEFGKSKIYLPLQEDVEVLNKEVCCVDRSIAACIKVNVTYSFVQMRLLTGNGH